MILQKGAAGNGVGVSDQDRMRVLTPDGLLFQEVPDSSDRSRLGAYWSAVGRFLETGDSSRIHEFEGVSIGGHELLTDVDAIEDAGWAGELSFEDIYEQPW